MNGLTVRRVGFVLSCLMVVTALVTTNMWVGLLGLGGVVVFGWVRKEKKRSSQQPVDTSLMPFLVEMHTLIGEVFSNLMGCAAGGKEEKQAFLNEWEAQEPEVLGSEVYLSFVRRGFALFREDVVALTPEKLSEIPNLQKAFYKMPYLRILLLNVIEKTEHATNALIENFISVSEKNRRALEEVKKRFEQQQGESFAVLMEKSSEIAQSYQLMRKEYDSLLSKNEEKANEFAHQIQMIFEQLRSINEILGQNKIIAVNLSIEGVKFGEKGKAIKVIVGEIQKLNQKIDQFTEEVSFRLEQFDVFNKDLWRDSMKQMGHSVNQFEKVSENASLLMQRLDGASRQMVEVTSLLQENATTVQQDLDSIIESLQFQDITRQQIENVMGYLGQIQDDIKKGSEALVGFGLSFDEWDVDKMDEAKEDMIKEAKVSSERFLLK